MRTGRILAGLLLAAALLATGAWAQDYPSGPNGEAAPANEGPPPDVARISLIHGDVSTQRGDTGDWAATTVNAPLVRGDEVATGEKSRAEIQLDYANIVRLAARSQIKIADLTRTRVQVQVAQGYASYTLFKGSEADVEIDSPNVAVHPLRPGRYRVQVNSDAETDVIVREGEAEITTPQGSTRVKSGEMITVRGTDNPEYRVAGAPEKDDWDRWNIDRDNVIKSAEGWRRTNRYYTGVNDLDAYGHWVYVPGYGSVWQPYGQSVEWAPYQTGRWVWEPYYGWTWVSYEPWGWAPYHYGRWFYYSGNWCWWPGPVFVGYRPLWSPAFVFFVGFGHHERFGFGSIGWFPVGPHDPFYPWYGRGFNRVNVVNITNINVTNVTVVNRGNFIAPLARRGHEPYYSNARLALTDPHVRGSITSVSSENFGHGGNTGWRHGVEEHELRASSVMTANLPVVPTRENLHAGSGGSAPAGIQPHNTDRFYTRHQPPAGPEPFHDQAARVQSVVGPQAVGAQAGAQRNVKTDVHSGPGQVDRHDVSGAGSVNAGGTAHGNVNERNRIGEVPRTGGSPAGGSASGGAAAGNATAGGAAAGGAASGGNPAPGESRERSGWRTFGPPSARSGDTTNGRSGGDAGNGRNPQTTTTPAPRSNDQGRVPRTDSASPAGRSGDNPNWQKFPSSGDRPSGVDHTPQPGAGSSSGDRPSGIYHMPQQPGAGPTQTPSAPSHDGGWQRFPANNDRGARPADPGNRTDSGGGKPPLELHRPVVTPRQPDTRNNEPSRAPDVHSQPSYSPSPQQHTESPRYSPPPSRSESGGRSYGGGSGGGSSSGRSYGGGGSSGGSSHSGGGSSHSSGGSSSHESSHSSGSSSSNPKHR
jgi:hypothetical protein